jgi:MoxR-like ATPase
MSTALPRERVSSPAAGPAQVVAALEANIARVIRGKAGAIRHAVVALLARGHLLIEDVPGVGKTTLARAMAASIGVTFHRIQFTSDLLPSDIVGVSVLDPKSGQFEFRKGAIFANLVLADEINRTTPRTQSALLEAMNDGQVSVDGRTYPLEPPFLVIATQNPEEHYGTYPLPESQMDRFLLRIRMDYPSPEDEKRILLESPGRAADTLAALPAVLSIADVRALQDATDRVHLAPELAEHIVGVARETRQSPHLALGVSPRGELAWRNAARAAALADGRDYVLPDDLKSLALPVLAHRVVGASPAEALGRSRQDVERVLTDILERMPAPG